MLTFSSNSSSKSCDGVSRRSFLQVGALGGLGLSLPTLLAHKRARAESVDPTLDVNCILIWTRGGTSHHDTFDPKPEAPLSVRGEFGVIDTAVPGVQFTEICPGFAKAAKRFAVLRGWNPRNGSHGRADMYVMSGRKSNQPIHYPCYGSVVSHEKGFKNVMPPFVQLGTQVDKRFGGGSPGILGLEHGAFEIADDPSSKNFTVRDITPPRGIKMTRVERRKKMLQTIDNLQKETDLQPTTFDALDETYKTALNMITAPETKKAFALETEDDKLRDGYGRNRFGQSCLLARRLIESGVRFVTVTDGGWDTHQNNFKSLKDRRLPPADQALPRLLEDLEDRGMLDTTLVLWLTDFGRTPKINAASGRDHWANSGFALAAGAGIPGGQILGATSDDGGSVIEDEYFTENIAATVYTKLGIPTDRIVHSIDGRPVRLIEGEPIEEWT